MILTAVTLYICFLFGLATLLNAYTQNRTDKYNEAHIKAREMIDMCLARNQYLPVVAETETERFKMVARRLGAAHIRDISNAKENEGNYNSREFDRAMKEINLECLTKSGMSGTVRLLHLNLPFMKAVAFIRMLGRPFSTCKIFESFTMANNVNGLCGAVSLLPEYFKSVLLMLHIGNRLDYTRVC